MPGRRANTAPYEANPADLATALPTSYINPRRYQTHRRRRQPNRCLPYRPDDELPMRLINRPLRDASEPRGCR